MGEQRVGSWKWRSTEEKTELLERFHASQLSRAEFCREEGISPSTLRNWLEAKIRKVEKSEKFIPVSLPRREAAEWSLELELSSGTKVRVR